MKLPLPDPALVPLVDCCVCMQNIENTCIYASIYAKIQSIAYGNTEIGRYENFSWSMVHLIPRTKGMLKAPCGELDLPTIVGAWSMVVLLEQLIE